MYLCPLAPNYFQLDRCVVLLGDNLAGVGERDKQGEGGDSDARFSVRGDCGVHGAVGDLRRLHCLSGRGEYKITSSE